MPVTSSGGPLTEKTELSRIDLLREGERAAMVATFVKLMLAISKGAVGIFSGSLALLADALNSGVDVIVSSISWVSLRLAQRNPDDEFQYGYFKVENLAALVISGFIIYFAVSIGFEGWNSFGRMVDITAPGAALAVAAFSAIVCLILVRYLSSVGKRTNSSSLMALAKDTLTDVLSSSIVLLAIVSTIYQIPYVEGVVSIAIAFLVLKVGLETAKDAAFSLLDVSPSKEIERRVRDISLGVEGVEGVTSLRLRRSGPVILGDISITTNRTLDVGRAHTIADEVERKAKDEVNCLETLDVHIEPFVPRHRLVAVPTVENRGMESRVSGDLGRAKFILIIGLGDGEPTVKKVIKNEFREERVLAGLSLGKSISAEDVDTVVTSDIGEVLFHSLRDSYIDIHLMNGETVSQVIEALERGELYLITEPTRESGEIAAGRKMSEMGSRSKGS